jgi:hypothetical protein
LHPRSNGLYLFVSELGRSLLWPIRSLPAARARRRADRQESAPTCRGVELIDRAGQADPERGLDRGGLARNQEQVKVFERLNVQTAFLRPYKMEARSLR